MADGAVTVRPAGPGDLAQIVRFIRELADFEGLLPECRPDPDALAEHLFGAHPAAEVMIADTRGEAVGFALFFSTFSTFLTRPGIWLEDLFVVPDHRGRGVGRALLAAVAHRARERGCGRLEWAVLDWNSRAIEFYTGLGAACSRTGPSAGWRASRSPPWRAPARLRALRGPVVRGRPRNPGRPGPGRRHRCGPRGGSGTAPRPGGPPGPRSRGGPGPPSAGAG